MEKDMTAALFSAPPRRRATKAVAVLGILFLILGLAIGDAGAIAVEKGNGETTTVNDPAITQGQGPNADGLNPAHGPVCGVLPEELPCARHADHPENPGAFANGVTDNPFGVNVGAWNAVFQSNDNSAICGIWATAEEVPEGEPPEAACDYEAP